MSRSDEEGFHPHPGDPWHPGWDEGPEDEDPFASSPRDEADETGADEAAADEAAADEIAADEVRQPRRRGLFGRRKGKDEDEPDAAVPEEFADEGGLPEPGGWGSFDDEVVAADLESIAPEAAPAWTDEGGSSVEFESAFTVGGEIGTDEDAAAGEGVPADEDAAADAEPVVPSPLPWEMEDAAAGEDAAVGEEPVVPSPLPWEMEDAAAGEESTEILDEIVLPDLPHLPGLTEQEPETHEAEPGDELSRLDALLEPDAGPGPAVEGPAEILDEPVAADAGDEPDVLDLAGAAEAEDLARAVEEAAAVLGGTGDDGVEPLDIVAEELQAVEVDGLPEVTHDDGLQDSLLSAGMDLGDEAGAAPADPGYTPEGEHDEQPAPWEPPPEVLEETGRAGADELEIVPTEDVDAALAAIASEPVASADQDALEALRAIDEDGDDDQWHAFADGTLPPPTPEAQPDEIDAPPPPLPDALAGPGAAEGEETPVEEEPRGFFARRRARKAAGDAGEEWRGEQPDDGAGEAEAADWGDAGDGPAPEPLEDLEPPEPGWDDEPDADEPADGATEAVAAGPEPPEPAREAAEVAEEMAEGIEEMAAPDLAPAAEWPEEPEETGLPPVAAGEEATGDEPETPADEGLGAAGEPPVPAADEAPAAGLGADDEGWGDELAGDEEADAFFAGAGEEEGRGFFGRRRARKAEAAAALAAEEAIDDVAGLEEWTAEDDAAPSGEEPAAAEAWDDGGLAAEWGDAGEAAAAPEPAQGPPLEQPLSEMPLLDDGDDRLEVVPIAERAPGAGAPPPPAGVDDAEPVIEEEYGEWQGEGSRVPASWFADIDEDEIEIEDMQPADVEEPAEVLEAGGMFDVDDILDPLEDQGGAQEAPQAPRPEGYEPEEHQPESPGPVSVAPDGPVPEEPPDLFTPEPTAGEEPDLRGAAAALFPGDAEPGEAQLWDETVELDRVPEAPQLPGTGAEAWDAPPLVPPAGEWADEAAGPPQEAGVPSLGGDRSDEQGPDGAGDPEAPPPPAGEVYDVVEDDLDRAPAPAPAEPPGPTGFDEDIYAGSGTTEHRGLAEAIAAAGDEDTELQALSAAMPGLDTGVVGFEDVEDLGTDEIYVPPARSDLGARILTGLILVSLLGASMWTSGGLLAAFIGVMVMIGLTEYFTTLRHKGYTPLVIFGYLGGIGALAGTWVWGPIAVPGAIAVTTGVVYFFYAFAPRRRDALVNGALTVVGMAWITGTVAFAMPIAASEHYRVLVFALVAATVAMDVGAYGFGRAWGSAQMAPILSPNKSIEGLAGGVVLCIGMAVLVGYFFEPFDIQSGAALGLVVAIAAPLGDLAESMFKRSLGVKDMGAILPGHGGIMDRVDSFLFVIPPVWVLYELLGYLT